MRRICLCTLPLALTLLAGCASESGGVGNKVLTDFGLKPRPEGQPTETDRVRDSLANVGPAELKRLNQKERQGRIEFQEDGLRGQYYKVVKVYEDFYPIEARAVSESTNRERGFNGFIEYTFQMYESPRRPSRTEAAAETATIPTGENGREIYRYSFNAGGVWDGSPGNLARRKD